MIYTKAENCESVLNELNHCIRCMRLLESKTGNLASSQLSWLYKDICELKSILDKNGWEYRICSSCGKAMNKGYLVWYDYACSYDCAVELYDGDVDKFEEELSRLEDVFYTEW